jgi:hypothetical protein
MSRSALGLRSFEDDRLKAGEELRQEVFSVFDKGKFRDSRKGWILDWPPAHRYSIMGPGGIRCGVWTGLLASDGLERVNAPSVVQECA